MKRVWTHAIASLAVCVMVACSGDSPAFHDAGAGFGGASGNAGIGGISGVGGFGAVGGTGNPATCGNRLIEAGEVCDDGNTLDDDYCRADCRGDTGFCGDNLVQSRVESCDPGNVDSPGCSRCVIEANSRCEGEPSLCGPPTLNWEAPLTSYARQDAETYCTWLANAQFGSASRVECPGFLTAIRLSVSECADDFASFADTCVGSLGQVLQCLRGTDVCDAITAGPTNDEINRCVLAACRSVCTRGTWSCNGNTARHCNQWGNGYEETDCGVGTCSTAFQGSDDPNEVCGLTICESNTWSCLGNTARLCASDRLSYAQEVDCGTSFCVNGGNVSTPMNQVCDVNECLSGTHNCNANATCTNVPGAFMCTCNSGYAGDGITCTDIDECTSNIDNCDPNATCANTVGSFMCMCNGDYNGSGTTCLRDECALNLHNCDANAHCTDTAQSFTCACNGGYAGNGVTCSDINECTSNHTCDTSPSACINDIGSHHCVCPDGYEGSGVGSSGCLDINECMTGDYTCDPNAGCINNAGSYGCTCNTGYGGDGTTCTPYATLTSLVPSYGTLVPIFEPNTITYNLSLPLAVDVLGFTATSANTVLVDGVLVASGAPSTPTARPMGNSLSTLMLSGAGLLDRTYTIPIARGVYTYVKPSVTTRTFWFGREVAISGNHMIVGAPFTRTTADDFGAGAVHFFERTPAGWVGRGSFRTNTEGALLGRRVAIDGATAVAGETQAARVYQWNGSSWSQQATLTRGDTAYPNDFGQSVGISGNTIVVGDPWEDGANTGVNPPRVPGESYSGAAYVFTRTGSTWSREAYLKASNTDSSDAFSVSVAIDGDTLVVGASGETSTATGIGGDQTINSGSGVGAAYVFRRTLGTWVQESYIKPSVSVGYVNFGIGVAIENDRIAVSMDPDYNTAPVVHTFERVGNTWTNSLIVPHPGTTPDDSFGTSIALWRDLLLIGQPNENGSATGIDRTANTNASEAGAAFLFRRSQNGWELLHYLKASNTDAGDHFGTAVAMDGFIAVGAPQEQSAAGTINGNQTDDTERDRGAVYVF